MNSSLSNTFIHLDFSVWRTIIIMGLFSLCLLAFSHSSRQKCVNYEIMINGAKNEVYDFVAGEALYFRTNLVNSAEITWNFGDSTDKIIQSSFTSTPHTFLKEGIYTVSAKTKMVCSDVIARINIKKPKTTNNTNLPVISGNFNPIIGQKNKYFSNIVDGKTYEWKIIDNSFYPIITNFIASYAFNKPGLYRLQLIINHDPNNKSAVVDINVTDNVIKTIPKPVPTIILPPPFVIKKDKKKQETNVITPSSPLTEPKPVSKTEPPPPPVIAKNNKIGNASFQALLESVIEGNIANIGEFDQYLYHKGNTPVHVVDAKYSENFSQYFNKIKGQKKFKVLSVELTKDPSDPTVITNIDVKMKGGKAWWKIF